MNHSLVIDTASDLAQLADLALCMLNIRPGILFCKYSCRCTILKSNLKSQPRIDTCSFQDF